MKRYLWLLLIAVSGPVSAQDFLWARDVGNGNVTGAKNIVVDGWGNSYTIGTFSGPYIDINPGIGVNILSAINGSVYLLKLDSVGTFVWARQFQHSYQGIACNEAGEVYLAGFFQAITDFDPDTVAAMNISPIGSSGDGYVLKLDTGGALEWVRHLAGVGASCIPRAITLDHSGNCIINGAFTGTVDFDPGTNTNNLTATVFDVFLCKLDSQGDFLWAQDQPVSGSMVVNFCLAVDGGDNIYSVSPFDTLSVSRFGPSGNFLWAKRFGDENTLTKIDAICADKEGNFCATGTFDEGILDFDPGPGIFALNPIDYDAFVYKLDSFGNFVWAKHFSGTENQAGKAIAVDSNNSVYITGYFQTTADFDPNAGVYNLSAVNNFPNHPDVFLVKISPSGNLLSARKMGGASQDESFGLAIDLSGAVYICGDFLDTADYDPGTAVFNLEAGVTYPDAFIVKLSSTSHVGLPLVESANTAILIYPNPATDELTIEAEASFTQYTITNSLGQVMMSEKLKRKTAHSIKALPAGVYYITLKGEQGSETRKFVKM